MEILWYYMVIRDIAQQRFSNDFLVFNLDATATDIREIETSC